MSTLPIQLASYGTNKASAGTIHRPGIFENEFRRAYAEGAVPQHWLNKVCQPRLPRSGIVIDQRYECSLSNIPSCRIIARETFVLPERNDLDLGKILLSKATGVVGRAVINENDFAIAIALTRKSTQAIFKKPFPVPVNNNNADFAIVFSRDHPCQVEAERCLSVSYAIFFAQYLPNHIKLIIRKWKLIVRRVKHAARIVSFVMKIRKIESKIRVVLISLFAPIDHLSSNVNAVVTPFAVQIRGQRPCQFAAAASYVQDAMRWQKFCAPIKIPALDWSVILKRRPCRDH